MNSPQKSQGATGFNLWEQHGYWAFILAVTVSYTVTCFFLFGAIFAGIIASLFAASVWGGIKIVVISYEQSRAYPNIDLNPGTERSRAGLMLHEHTPEVFIRVPGEIFIRVPGDQYTPAGHQRSWKGQSWRSGSNQNGLR